MDTSFALSASQRADMEDVWPSLKRSAASLSGSADIIDSANELFSSKRFAGHGAFESQFRAAVPDQLAAGMHFLDTGFATSDQQTDQIVVVGNVARSFEDGGYEQSYVANMPLWASAQETIHDEQYEAVTLASPAVLNYLFELGSVAEQANALVRRGAVPETLTDLAERYKPLIAATALEAEQKWSLLGNMASVLDSTRYANSTAARLARGPTERLIGTSTTERSHVFNCFAPDLRPGDRVFWVFRDVDISWTNALLDPHGNAVVGRAAYPPRTLQVVGFSHRQVDVIGHDSSATRSIFDFSDPRDEDLDYVRRATRLRTQWIPFDWDENAAPGDEYKPREPEADLAGALAEVPELVYDQYMYGYATAAGIVRSVAGRHTDTGAIRWGLRSNEKIKQLPVVELYTSLH